MRVSETNHIKHTNGNYKIYFNSKMQYKTTENCVKQRKTVILMTTCQHKVKQFIRIVFDGVKRGIAPGWNPSIFIHVLKGRGKMIGASSLEILFHKQIGLVLVERHFQCGEILLVFRQDKAVVGVPSKIGLVSFGQFIHQIKHLGFEKHDGFAGTPGDEPKRRTALLSRRLILFV